MYGWPWKRDDKGNVTRGYVQKRDWLWHRTGDKIYIVYWIGEGTWLAQPESFEWTGSQL